MKTKGERLVHSAPLDLSAEEIGCKVKRIFRSRKDAKRFAREHGFHHQEPYHCRYCTLWHLATRRD